MKKKEEQPGDIIPVFGVVYNITKPEELQKAYERAVKQHQLVCAELNATRLRATRFRQLVSFLHNEISCKKEVCHE